MNSVCDSLPVKVYFYVRFFMRVDSDHLPEESEKNFSECFIIHIITNSFSKVV